MEEDLAAVTILRRGDSIGTDPEEGIANMGWCLRQTIMEDQVRVGPETEVAVDLLQEGIETTGTAIGPHEVVHGHPDADEDAYIKALKIHDVVLDMSGSVTPIGLSCAPLWVRHLALWERHFHHLRRLSGEGSCMQ